MTAITEPNRLNDILKWEQENSYSREVVTVLSGQDLALGTVIGKIAKSTPATGAPDAGNTGGGNVSAVTAGSKTKLGTYKIACISASPLAFSVVDPDGNALPDAEAGAYVNEQINFTIADGSPAIADGDIWTIEVIAGSGEIKQIDFDAVDGSAEAYGFVIDACDAMLGAISGVAIVRDAVITSAGLVWPATSPAVTDAQKAAALAQLAAKGIIVRGEA
jgi:ABC-type amino acid transport substrate-binding protein